MLHGKTALIIGATSDIGESIAQSFARNGVSQLILHGRNEIHLQKISTCCKEFGAKVNFIQGDLSNSSNTKLCCDKICQLLNFPLDVFVYCPGICGDMDPVAFLQMKNDFLTVFQINFTSCVKIFESIINHMSDKSSAIFISSTNSFEPMECGSAYCSSKAAMTQYMKNKAKELLPKYIRVNSIAPGMIKTKLHDQYFESKEELDEFFDEISNDTPLKRITSIDGVVNSVLFFASDLSSDINGTELVIDCGASLYHDVTKNIEVEE